MGECVVDTAEIGDPQRARPHVGGKRRPLQLHLHRSDTVRLLHEAPAHIDPQVVDTFWHGGRIVGIWDLETGFKWTSRCGNYSANLGYIFSAWTNTLQTDEWIRGVRENTFIGMDNTMTFDGLVVRFEARF